ncbi:MAG: Hsp33 family molecular chaperone HslO [candidate division WOR-3 bacterium]
MSKIVKAKYNNFVIISTITTDLVSKACQIHQTNPPASAAFGRALTGLVLLSSAFEGTKVEKLIMQFLTDGEISEITVETNMKKQFRGFIRNPNPHYEIKSNKLPVGDVVGKGLLYFYRYFNNEVYQSVSKIVSGEIAEDIAYFLYNSEQIPSAIALGVLVNKDGSIKNAGGIFVYSRPGISESELIDMENKFKNIKSITTLIDANLDEYDLISIITKSWQFLEESSVEYNCWCNLDSIKRAILSIPKEEILEEVERNSIIEVVCRYCKKSYIFNKFQIFEIYEGF